MSEPFESLLAFFSAGLVGLIVLGFALIFAFFSGSAVLVLTEFLPFVRSFSMAALAILVASALVALLSLLSHMDPVWAPPIGQALTAGIAWGVLRAGRLQRPLLGLIGAFLLASGLIYAAALVWPALEPLADRTGPYALMLLALGVFGFWPFILTGIVMHRREKPVEWFLSLRYLVAKRRQTFISVITVICVMGVALGVAVISVVLSVMNGFSEVWEGKIIGARAHFAVYSRLGPFEDYEKVRDQVVRVPGVTGAAPFLQTDAILRGDGGQIQAVLMKGIDPLQVGRVTSLEKDLISGALADLEPDLQAEGTARLPGVIFGAELADRFFLRVGDPVILISPTGGAPTPLGPAPRMRRFRVAGMFRANFFQFDESFVYANLATVQRFMKLDDVVSGIEVRTVDPYRSRAVANQVTANLGELFFARDWKSFYPGFFNALKTERVMMFVLLSFIMVVAGFIIIATLIMMIMEKSRDIAILKTMGCADDAVRRVFAIQGFLIGIAGVGLGLGIGLVITWNLARIQAIVERIVGYDVLPANIYQLQNLPYQIIPEQLVGIAMIAMVLSIGATLLPCWQAARLDPAEALRYE